MILGPRFLIEAGFIVAVAVVAGIERAGTWSIIGLVAGAWIIVALFELGFWLKHASASRSRADSRGLTPQGSDPSPAPADPRGLTPQGSDPSPAPADPRGLTPQGSDPSSAREPAVVRPEPVRAPEPPRIAAAPPPPEPEPDPEPEREPEPEPEPTVAYLPTNDAPREWNLWDLERASRDHVTDDVAKNEERAYLLMYLREFAGPDGILPADFDGLVRDAFGDLVRAAAT